MDTDTGKRGESIAVDSTCSCFRGPSLVHKLNAARQADVPDVYPHDACIGNCDN